MSGQTIRRSRVAAYLGKGPSFFPCVSLDSSDIYIYTSIILFPCRLYGNSRSSWRKSSICNLNLFSRQKARSPLASVIVLEIVIEFSFISLPNVILYS